VVAVALALWLVLGAAPAIFAEEGVVTPDRPDVTDSTETVPLGAFQTETGVEYTRARQARRPAQQFVDFSGTLRVGLSERIELRVLTDPVIQLQAAEDVGHGNVGFGLKYRFLDAVRWWPSLGVEPVVLFPIAPDGSARPDLGARALVSWQLSAGWSLDVNAGFAAAAQTNPGGYLIQALASGSLGKQLTEKLSGFVDLFYASAGQRDGRYVFGLDTGLTYLVARWLALDAAVTTALAGRGPDVAVQAGISMRFGK